MPFSPSDISGLKIWLKADAGAGSSDNDPVATWTDQSGGSHNFTQATSGKRPLYKVGIRNGLPVVRFDESQSSELDGGDLSALFSTGASVFAAVSGTGVSGKLQVYDHANIDDWWAFSGGAGYWGPFRSSRLSNTPSSGLPVTGWNVWSMTADNGSNYKMYLDGTIKINDSGGFTFQGGTSHNIGHQRTNNHYASMDLGELIVYDSALNDTDRQSVEAYLTARWGTDPNATVTVPAAAAGTGQALVPTVTATNPNATVSPAVATGTGQANAPVPKVTLGAVVATGIGQALIPTVTVPASVTVTVPNPGAGAGEAIRARVESDTLSSFTDWSSDIQGPNGGANVVTAAPFKSARITWTVEGPGSFEIDLRESDVSIDWQAGTHRVVLNGPFPFSGYITRLTRSGPPKDLAFKASGLGLQSILDWRIVRHATTLNDLSSVLVEWLLEEAETQFNGNMGFQMGTVVGTTTTRLRNYCFGVVIGDAIRELAAVGRGFDWEIDADGDLNIWNNTRGIDTGLVLAEEHTQDWNVELDTSELLTTVSAIGDPSQPFGPIHDMVRNLHAADTFGRHEIAIDVDSTDRDELIDAARAELKASGGARLVLHTMWIDDRGPWRLGDVWLQDTITAVLPDYFGGSQTMRCTDVSVTLDPLPERYFIEHTFDALVTDDDLEDGDPDEES